MSVLTDFVDKIIQRFPPSFRWDEVQKKSWSGDMIEELSGFADDVLTRALREMIRTRKEAKTPTVAECIGACLEAKKWIEAEKNKGQLPLEQGPAATHMDWTAERLKLATELACDPNNPMVKQAAKEGWIGVLHGFVRKHQRMPEASCKIAYRKNSKTPLQYVSEVEWCKREARDFEEAYAAAVKGGFAGAATLEALGAEMLKRRNEKIDRILNGVVA